MDPIRPHHNPPAHTFKLLLMGDSGVGKSSILLRFVEDKFLGEDYQAATIGVDFKVKFIEVDGERVKLTIWDTAGQERFRTLTSSYYRGAQGVILVYDVTVRESFENLRQVWLKELRTHVDTSEMVLMVVANKIDKEGRAVSTAEGTDYAKELNALYMECSALTKVGVEAAFEELVHKIIHSPHVSTTAAHRESPRQLRRLSATPAEATLLSGQCGC